MRLLFIYFYEKKGTFEKGTIIELSKKYSVEYIEDYKFKLEKRDSFQDDFYGDNIDIGAIIGENGTGKSVLINSLRDGNNDYSLAVYENGDGEFFYDDSFEDKFLNKEFKWQVIKIFINNNKIEFYEKTSFIYYSPIIDYIKDGRKNLKDISDKAQLNRISTNNLSISLSLIENQDIHYFFYMNRPNSRSYQLRLSLNENLFQLSRKLIIESYENEFIEILESQYKDDMKLFLEKNTWILSDSIIDTIYNDLENKIYSLYNNLELLEQFLKELKKIIRKDISLSLIEKEDYIKVISSGDYINYKKELISSAKLKNHQSFKDLFHSIISKLLSTVHRTSNLEFDLIYKLFLDLKKSFENDKEIFTYLCIEEFKFFVFDYPLMQNDYFNRNDNLSKIIKRNIILKMLEMDILKFKDFTYLLNNMTEDIFDKYIIQLLNNKEVFKSKKNLFLYLFKYYEKGFDIPHQREHNEKIQLFMILSILYQEADNSLYETFKLQDNIKSFSYAIEELNKHFKNYSFFHEIKKFDGLLNIKNKRFLLKLIKHPLQPFSYELYPPLSSGQKAILFIFARIDNAIKQIKSKNITILLDEADLKLHLEWQRQFINDLVEFLKSYPDKKFYVLYATHSPMILSDITDDRIVFLKKEGDYSVDKSINEKKSTFGANIYDLYHDSFFMDKYMGEFAFNKINDVINMVNLYKIVIELTNDKEKEKLNDYERIYNFNELFKSYVLYYPNEKIDSKKLYEKREEIKSNIENKKEELTAVARFIGEPLLRNKLEDDLNSMGREFDIDEVVETLQGLSQQEIKEKLSKYSESIQLKILKKLFASEDKS